MKRSKPSVLSAHHPKYRLEIDYKCGVDKSFSFSFLFCPTFFIYHFQTWF